VIKCPNCGTSNLDGTLLCESCAWDVSDVPPFEDPTPAAADPLAESPSMSFDVVPAQDFAPAAVPVAGDSAAPFTEEPAPTAVPAAAAIPAVSILVPPTVMQPPAPAAEVAPELPPLFPEPTEPSPPPPTFEPLLEQPAPFSEPPELSAQPPATEPPMPAPTPQPPRVSPLPPHARPRLVVVRGLHTNAEYPIYDGPNFVGRPDDTPVDIDLTDQEAPNRAYASRQHACITWENGTLFVEDLNSANGTFLNRTQLTPRDKKALKSGDYLQMGMVMFQVRY
jgi:hypothetical protein